MRSSGSKAAVTIKRLEEAVSTRDARIAELEQKLREMEEKHKQEVNASTFATEELNKVLDERLSRLEEFFRHSQESLATESEIQAEESLVQDEEIKALKQMFSSIPSSRSPSVHEPEIPDKPELVVADPPSPSVSDKSSSAWASPLPSKISAAELFRPGTIKLRSSSTVTAEDAAALVEIPKKRKFRLFANFRLPKFSFAFCK